MKEQLIKYGFTEAGNGWIEFIKNGWEFDYNPSLDYVWIHTPKGGDEDGICVHNLTYEKIINLIEFISEY